MSMWTCMCKMRPWECRTVVGTITHTTICKSTWSLPTLECNEMSWRCMNTEILSSLTVKLGTPTSSPVTWTDCWLYPRDKQTENGTIFRCCNQFVVGLEDGNGGQIDSSDDDWVWIVFLDQKLETVIRIKKTRVKGKWCHTKTMMKRNPDETLR